MSEIEVSLSLIGREYDLEYVNKTLGIEPDYARRHEGEKDRLPEPQLSELTERLRKIQDLEPDLGWSLDNILLGTTEWGLSTEMQHARSLEPLLDQLLAKVTCPSETLLQVARQCHAQWGIEICINIREDEEFPDTWDVPAISFPTHFLRFCAEIEAEMDLDTYVI